MKNITSYLLKKKIKLNFIKVKVYSLSRYLWKESKYLCHLKNRNYTCKFLIEAFDISHNFSMKISGVKNRTFQLLNSLSRF